jgi:hypothetical protein
MADNGKTLNDALMELRGLTLGSVEFVMDYVQLRFGGPVLTAYIHPSLIANDKVLFWAEPGYRDSLCDLISLPVDDTGANDQEVKIHFQNGTVVRISLAADDYRGPEALEFVSDSGPSWIV